MQAVDNGHAGDDHLRLVAKKTVLWFERHQTALNNQPLRYLDYLTDVLMKSGAASVPDRLMQLAPEISPPWLDEFIDLKFSRFSNWRHIKYPVLQPHRESDFPDHRTPRCADFA